MQTDNGLWGGENRGNGAWMESVLCWGFCCEIGQCEEIYRDVRALLE